MDSRSRLKVLKSQLTEALKKLVRVDAEAARYQFEKKFYGTRMDLINNNIETLRTGNYIVSLNEYRLILRDYYYNRGHHCEALIEYARCEEDLKKIKEHIWKVESDMDQLILELESTRVILPFRKTDEQK